MGHTTHVVYGQVSLGRRHYGGDGRPDDTSGRAARWPSLRVQILVAPVFLVVASLAGGWIWQSWGGAFATHRVGDAASLAGALIAAGCSGWAARSSRGRERRGWLALTAGLLAWAIGAAIWSYYETWRRLDPFPSPSIADVAFLLFPVGAVAALLWLSDSVSRQSRIRQVLDAMIVATSVIILAWVAVLERVFQGDDRSGLATAFH